MSGKYRECWADSWIVQLWVAGRILARTWNVWVPLGYEYTTQSTATNCANILRNIVAIAAVHGTISQPIVTRASIGGCDEDSFRFCIHARLSLNAAFAQRINAGCDAFLMPSRYQPGGLGQLIARYGPVPLVRATHRFAETVRESWEGNGFHFHAYETSMVADMIARCLITFRDAPS